MLSRTCYVAAIAGAAVCGWSTRASTQDAMQAARSETLRFSGPAARALDLRALNGTISVVGADTEYIEVVAHRRTTAASDADLQAADRDVVLDYDDEDGVHVGVRDINQAPCGEHNVSDRRWRRPHYRVTVDFAVRVPRNTLLTLCTINHGDIRVEGTAGDFDVRSVNGRIAMSRVRGAGRAITVNGAVTVTFAAAPTGPSLFKTINGNIDVMLPEGLSADLLLKTFNGGLYSDFDAQPLGPGAIQAGDRRDGRYLYRSDRFTAVRVGAGGPELTFDDFNGDVRVMRLPR
jgi:hypothetical protein